MKSVSIGIFWLLLFPAALFAQRTVSLTVGHVRIDGPQLPPWMTKTVRSEEFVDMRFIGELDQSGYIDGFIENNRTRLC
jgi:hypothetical protein